MFGKNVTVTVILSELFLSEWLENPVPFASLHHAPWCLDGSWNGTVFFTERFWNAVKWYSLTMSYFVCGKFVLFHLAKHSHPCSVGSDNSHNRLPSYIISESGGGGRLVDSHIKGTGVLVENLKRAS